MAILVDQRSRVLVQGVSGREGAYHTARMLAAGSNVVAGVTPRKGGQTVAGVPVFDSVAEAVDRCGPTVAVVFVPAHLASDAVLEAGEAGLKLVVCISEGMAVSDVSRAYAQFRCYGAQLLGPNCPGLVSPGACNVGIMPAGIFRLGPVGLVSRSGTLTYLVVSELSRAGLGQSTCVGIGGDAVHGLGFIDCLALFESDPQTEAIVLVGEIGGDEEERAAAFVESEMSKPVIAYLAGFSAPTGKQMGHAGAIISGSGGTATAKAASLEAAGVRVAQATQEVPELVHGVLREALN
jgi:succinyl-CoA synthetase alpha subunit